MKILSKDYTTEFKHYGTITIPKGTQTNNVTASGIDEKYNFVCSYKWIPLQYPDYANTLQMDVESYGINVPNDYLIDVTNTIKLKGLKGDDVYILPTDELIDAQMNALLWHCLNNDGLSKLTSTLSQSQKECFINYAIKECLVYPSSHSMRFTILKDVVKSTYLINSKN